MFLSSLKIMKKSPITEYSDTNGIKELRIKNPKLGPY